MINFDAILVMVGLRSSFAERYTRTLHSLSPQLVDAMHAIHLRMVDAGEHRCYGWYCPARDVMALNVTDLAYKGRCINNTMAHELIHATGHHRRLNRGHVGVYSFCGGLEHLSEEEANSEEVVAQYGAKLLLAKLGIECAEIESDTTSYLMRHGRPDGRPSDSEALQAVQAVKYILQAMQETKEDSYASVS